MFAGGSGAKRRWLSRPPTVAQLIPAKKNRRWPRPPNSNHRIRTHLPVDVRVLKLFVVRNGRLPCLVRAARCRMAAAAHLVQEVEIKSFECRQFGSFKLPQPPATAQLNEKDGGSYSAVACDVYPIAKGLVAVSTRYGITFFTNAAGSAQLQSQNLPRALVLDLICSACRFACRWSGMVFH